MSFKIVIKKRAKYKLAIFWEFYVNNYNIFSGIKRFYAFLKKRNFIEYAFWKVFSNSVSENKTKSVFENKYDIFYIHWSLIYLIYWFKYLIISGNFTASIWKFKKAKLNNEWQYWVFIILVHYIISDFRNTNCKFIENI